MLSRVIIDGSLDHSVRPFPALDDALDMLHCLRGEELLSGLLAYACRYIFNNEELTTMFQGTGYFSICHCFFHSECPFISPSGPKIDPQIGGGLV